MSEVKPTPVVIDCDPGTDDAWAVISLLKNEANFNIKVKGITIANGNTTVENGCRNILLLLKTLNRLDVPVYAGAESSLLVKPGFYTKFHGDDGFKDVYHDKPGKDLVQKEHAVEALKGFIEENQNEIVVFAVAPLTNVALLYKIYPEISMKMKSLWVMGGNHLGVGNATKTGEFNFWSDPEAAHIVLTESKCPMYIYPWEPSVKASEATPLDEWRLTVLPKYDSIITKFMDPIDKHIHIHRNFIPCDAYLTCCFLVPQMITKMEHAHVTIELGGNHTRGMMVIDHKRLEKPNAFVIHAIDVEMFKRFLCWLCDHREYDDEFVKEKL